MKARSALGGLALVLGMTLPAAAQTPDAVAPGAGGVQLAQAPAPGTGPGMAEHRRGGHGGWHHRKMHRMHHRVSLAGQRLLSGKQGLASRRPFFDRGDFWMCNSVLCHDDSSPLDLISGSTPHDHPKQSVRALDPGSDVGGFGILLSDATAKRNPCQKNYVEG